MLKSTMCNALAFQVATSRTGRWLTAGPVVLLSVILVGCIETSTGFDAGTTVPWPNSPPDVSEMSDKFDRTEQQ